ncbi:MAG: Uma2 family endonuclease [Lachnospiraceae bacterium]|nr:Uma2 family endonuclease [Lachnospiraceae bacterium]
MTLEEMRARRRELGFSYEKLSELSGVPVGTIRKIFGGYTKAPRLETIERLTLVLAPSQFHRTHRNTVNYTNLVPDQALHEYASGYGDQSAAEKLQGNYTISDLESLPKDKRFELIDGYIYEMSQPSIPHVLIMQGIYRQLWSCIDRHKAPCKVMVSDVGVRLDRDDQTMVSPDIILFCDRSMLQYRYIDGAPDLVMEILSPSNRKYDQEIKKLKYESAGVREYWLIDPERQKIILYYFKDLAEDDIFIYGFHDQIPVGISEGKCEIDFDLIYNELAEDGFL